MTWRSVPVWKVQWHLPPAWGRVEIRTRSAWRYTKSPGSNSRAPATRYDSLEHAKILPNFLQWTMKTQMIPKNFSHLNLSFLRALYVGIAQNPSTLMSHPKPFRTNNTLNGLCWNLHAYSCTQILRLYYKLEVNHSLVPTSVVWVRICLKQPDKAWPIHPLVSLLRFLMTRMYQG